MAIRRLRWGLLICWALLVSTLILVYRRLKSELCTSAHVSIPLAVVGVTAPSEPPRPRTLTEALRAMSADELATLLTARPDLLDPVPEDIAQLASRSTDLGLDHPSHRRTQPLAATLSQKLYQRCLIPPPSAILQPCSANHRPRSLQRRSSFESALCYGATTTSCTWYGRFARRSSPIRAAWLPRRHARSRMTRSMRHWRLCGPEARAVLERLLWSPTGAVRHADRAVTVTSASSPIERLLSHQLLRPLDSETVIIPREVAWRLRGARFSAEPVATEPPVITGRLREPDLVDRAAAGAAFALLHDIELVAQRLESTTPKLLRGGGLASRDVTDLARHLDADPAHAAFVVECAAAARLVAPARTAALLPTPDYDKWLGSDAATRWRLVAEAWLAADRFFARSAEVGGHALGQEAYAPSAAGLRITVLRLVADAAPGTVLDLDQLADAATWHRPRLSHGPLTAQQLVQWTWREASWLGLAALGAVSSLARVPLQPDQPMPTELTELFPAPVTHFVIQTDLTAVTAGPLRAHGCHRAADAG